MDFLYDDPCWDFDYWEYKIEEMRESDEWFGMDECRAARLIQVALEKNKPNKFIFIVNYQLISEPLKI